MQINTDMTLMTLNSMPAVYPAPLACISLHYYLFLNLTAKQNSPLHHSN